MILLGFRYLSSSIPLIVFAGVAVGVGLIFSFLLQSMARNPLISNSLVRWAFIGFSLVEVSGFIGLVYSFLLLYALLLFALWCLSLRGAINAALSSFFGLISLLGSLHFGSFYYWVIYFLFFFIFSIYYLYAIYELES